MHWRICLLWLLVFIDVSNARSLTRLLIIGDSVDRYAISDYCAATGGVLHLSSSTATVSGSNVSIAEAFKTVAIRAKSHEIRICDGSLKKNVIIGYIFNKMAMTTEGPWHLPKQTTWGIDNNILQTNLTDILSTLRITLLPALTQFPLAMGGLADGLLLNSVFWDVSHLHVRLQEQHTVVSKEENHEWLESWYHNASIFIKFIKDTYSISPLLDGRNSYLSAVTSNQDSSSIEPISGAPVWLGWRTANDVTIGNRDGWNTAYSRSLILSMNNMSYQLANESCINWVDFFHMPMARRDNMHPSATSLVRLLHRVLELVRVETGKVATSLQYSTISIVRSKV